MKLILTTFTYLFFITICFAQNGTVSGTIYSSNNTPLSDATIQIKGTSVGTTSNSKGHYKLSLKEGAVTLLFHHIGHEPQEKNIEVIANQNTDISITLIEKTEVLRGVEIADYRESEREKVSATRIEPISAQSLVTPFGDFNKILTTLPGVVSNNELSSAYSVRGGSFDENLVYVNDIPIYRPFLISSGQQEGLSFVNSDLVENVEFSAGGWQPKYGDKLSSVLNVKYKEPTSFAASASVHLLGGSAHVEGTSPDEKVTYVAGVRHKSAQYLLNTLETQGQYLPRFTDVQGYVGYQISKNTHLGVLTSYARNRYLTEPASRETDFGTFNQSLRLYVAFEGREILEYDTYQGGLKLSHKFNNKLTSDLIVSGVKASEREYTDVEGGYRLCDVDKNTSSGSFNECIYIRGIGSNYDYGRNILDANIINIENRNTYTLDDDNILQFGFGYSYQDIDDQLDEYAFRDSADYVLDIDKTSADNNISKSQYTGFVQNTSYFDKGLSATYGLRFNYTDLNGELLISPRLQLSYKPSWERDIIFTGAVGVYQQPPFYREMRGYDGSLNTNLKAQKSMHIIAGMDMKLNWWERKFKFTGEIYYKKMSDIVAYDIDNVKLRYYANNDTKAFATGFDMRISGEFVPGTQSWFSLGVMNVREDLEADNRGYIRRPTDQRLNLAIFFQDHLPTNPTVRVSLSLFLGTGLPFGPPQEIEQRNVFNGATYRRLDVGFSKIFYLNTEKYNKKRSLTLSAEILNLLGTSNAISYTWINDVNNDQYAVPNTLSARFLNVKLSLKI